MKILLAQPRGFCAGVDRAIEIVERALEQFGAPIYVRHEIVHNKHVVESLRAKGAVFVEEISEIPAGGRTIFSAHGVSDRVVEEAAARGLPTIDATCPLVTKVHNQARRYEKDERQIILIGHAGHPEVEGTAGRVKQPVLLVQNAAEAALVQVDDPDQLAYVTQTTLSIDDTKDIIATLKARFPAITGPDTKDICYATQNRQNAVKEMLPHIDLLLVIGAKNSSNSNRLRDLGEEKAIGAYLIDDKSMIQEAWFSGVETVGVTAGASAPEVLVNEVVEYLQQRFGAEIAPWGGVQETITFNLPPELRGVAA